MPYDVKNDIKEVMDYYNNDPLQKRFSALITGETGSGKTFLFRTARKPIFIDSFDPGGTKCLKANKKWLENDPRRIISICDEDNPKGQIIADTRWENEDPYNPTVFNAWTKETDRRFGLGFYDKFGTYCLDSASTFADAVMNSQLESSGIAGQMPRFRKDYNPQKVNVINRIKKFMTLHCDFILTGHLDTVKDVIGRDKYGDPTYKIKYRFMTTGKAVVTIPLQFDELYVLEGTETSSGIERKLLIDAQGTYVARSRLKADGLLEEHEDADIKQLLKKIGLDWEDKEPLEL